MGDVPRELRDRLDEQDTETLRGVAEYVTASLDEGGPGDRRVPRIENAQKDGYTEVTKWTTCAGGCRRCPHGPYVYQAWHDDDGPHLVYQGLAAEAKHGTGRG